MQPDPPDPPDAPHAPGGLAFARLLASAYASAAITVLAWHQGVGLLGCGAAIALGCAYVYRCLGKREFISTATFVVPFAGMLAITCAGLFAGMMVQHPLWPKAVVGIAVDRAGEYGDASAFVFSAAEVRSELFGTAATVARSRTIADAYCVAPVVGPGWTREQPVVVWAVGPGHERDQLTRAWAEPVRGGARVVGFNATDYIAAVADACARHGLQAARNPVLIEWMAEPGEAVAGAWLQLALTPLIAVALAVAVAASVRCFGRRAS